MATNNLLVNNESKVLYDVQKRVERSGHNLSQSRKFPAKVGYIYPFFCRKTLPSDSFKIFTNILIKQLQPLLVPQMVSFTVNTAFYWVDYQLAFPEFEYFMINQKGLQDIELPYVHLSCKDGYNNILIPYIADNDDDRVSSDSKFALYDNLRTFLDFTRNESSEKIEALPFWAYQAVYRDYYLNIDRLSSSEYNDWFPSNPNDWKLKPGENFAIGSYTLSSEVDGFKSISGKYINFDFLRSHNVRGDYFVNSYPTPLRGDIPRLVNDISISDFTAKLNSSLSLPDILNKPLIVKASDGIFAMGDNKNMELRESSSAYETSRVVGEVGTDSYSDVLSASNDSLFGSDTDVFGSISYNFNKLSYLLNGNSFVRFSDVSSLQNSFSITTRQLRLLESLTRKREIDVLMKPRLKNYLQTYFGVKNYINDSLYQPVFIGSTTQQILINDIDQTVASADSPLGRQGATAMSLGSGYVGEYFCRNYGCLLGVMYILPDYDYEPALPREWSERTPDDFYNPEFAHLSMQGILNKELYVSNDNTWNNEVLGYGGIYDNYRTSTNLVCGDLLNSSYGDVQQFAQVRRFNNTNKPEITTSFLNSRSAFDSSVFSVPSLPPFIAQCVTRVEAVRPLPEIATPRDM